MLSGDEMYGDEITSGPENDWRFELCPHCGESLCDECDDNPEETL